MNLWQFIKPKLDSALIEKVEEATEEYAFRNRLVPTQSLTREAQTVEILSIFASGNVAVPICETYGEAQKQSVLGRLDEKEYPDLAFVMFTSGTTGTPKGVMLTHENIIENLKAIDGYFQISKTDRILIARPLVHIAVLTGEILFGLYRGAELLFYEENFMPKRLAKDIMRQRATAFCCTPTMFYHLAPYLENTTLRTVVLSGERLSKVLFEEIKSKFSRIEFYNVYGLTEHSPRICALTPKDFLNRPQSVGKPISGVEAKIEQGELCVRSKCVMKGYYHDPELTREKIRDGWLHTGDMAEIDNDGYLTILGRRDELIIRSGLNVYPQEIENIALACPGVEGCLAFAEDDLNFGQRICLKIVGNISTDEVRRFLILHAPPHLLPNQIENVGSLPLTASGKVKREKK